jgi:cytochrome c
MDSFEFNKIAGAVLGTALAVFGIGELTKIVYHVEHPEKQGYVIEIAEAATGGEATAGGETKALPLAELLKTADAAKGATVAKKCTACHDMTKGGPNKVGPNLWDIVDRPIAGHVGYQYSPEMTAKAAEVKTWSYEALNAFLIKPSAYVPKTKMAAFPGLKDKDRADILAYLQSLSDSPKPFPAQ